MWLEKYSVAEMMACLCAREWNDWEIGLGPGLRSAVLHAALRLARAMHAPNMSILTMAYNPVGPIARMASDFPALKHAESLMPGGGESFLHIPKGYADFTMLGGMQVDKYGNLNLTCIGDWKHPKLRSSGAAGLTACSWVKRVYIWMNEHTKRNFVDRVDFITYPGYLDGLGARERAGYKWGGPVMVMSPLAVMDFHPETKRMRLKSLYPEVSVQEVADNTGFELIIPREVPRTVAPTEEELRVLRTVVDPDGILREFLPFG